MLECIIIIFLVAFLICLVTFYNNMGKFNGCKNETLKRKAVFITGCDTGFGYSLILHNLNSSEDDTKGARIMIAGCYYPGGSSEGTYEYLIPHFEIMY